jgi:hypothetical protein
MVNESPYTLEFVLKQYIARSKHNAYQTCYLTTHQDTLAVMQCLRMYEAHELPYWLSLSLAH